MKGVTLFKFNFQLIQKVSILTIFRYLNKIN